MKYHTLKSGTKLQVIDIKGKDYLQVAQRIIWLREESPLFSIETEILERTKESCLTRAVIKDQAGRVIAMGHKFEDRNGFPDFIEKSETGAIGRALALCGYGTQFCADDLDEGKRIVDSPIEAQKPSGKPSPIKAPQKPIEDINAELMAASDIPEMPQYEASSSMETGLEDYVISVGKKFYGKRLSEVPLHELEGYAHYLETNSNGKPLSAKAKEFIDALDRFKGAQDVPF